jgi:beta-xylosidase
MDQGIALSVTNEVGHDIESGCIIERPKVIHNAKTGKYVMYFHLELKGKGYKTARVGIAVADKVTGPYRFLKSLQPNGYESRDQTVFVDNDGAAYHFFSSNHNQTMRIIRLSDDYLSHTKTETVMADGDKTEAPAICFKDGWYFLIGSGCTGWMSNPARSYRARSIMGPWERLENPCVRVNPANGLGPERTWGCQSTFILKVADDDYIAMFDMWRPKNAVDGRYAWVPVTFTKGGKIKVIWKDVVETRAVGN